MSDPLLTFFKYLFLVVLYLFFLRVLRAVWVETREPKLTVQETPPASAADPTVAGPLVAAGAAGAGAVPAQHDGANGAGAEPTGAGAAAAGHLVVRSGPDLELGRAIPVPGEVSVGRSPGCGVSLTDDFVSQLHARLFRRDGDIWVEDLGSTNGTFVNDARVTGPVRLGPGDHLRVGRTELELVAGAPAPAWDRR